MIPLLVLSIIAIGVALERAFFYTRLEQGGERFRARLHELISSGQFQDAIGWLKGLRGPASVTALAALESRDESEPVMEATMASRARLEVPSLRRYLGVLDTIVTAAPLVGLLGTITGMMGTFHQVAERLSKNPSADTTGITAGIGEALITTATGIAIAVVSLIFHNIYEGMAETAMDNSEVVAAEVVSSLEGQREKRGARS
ncbi:MAG TPA: MotA/TolQ/ExbB proton channel family protein [Candidatus Xenobia bacterium]